MVLAETNDIYEAKLQATRALLGNEYCSKVDKALLTSKHSKFANKLFPVALSLVNRQNEKTHSFELTWNQFMELSNVVAQENLNKAVILGSS